MSKKKSVDPNLYVSKDEFQRLQEKVHALLKTTEQNDFPLQPPAAPPPRPPNRTPSQGSSTNDYNYSSRPVAGSGVASPMTTATAPPGNSQKNHPATVCKRPGCDHAHAHNYSEVVLPATSSDKLIDIDDHTYEKLANEEDIGNDTPSRLRRVDLNQQSIIKAQDSLKKDVTDIKSILEKLQQKLDKTHFQVMETSDHLGQQILHVRKDIQAATQKEPSTFRPQDYAFQERLQQPKRTHKFEWEVCNVDNLVRTQRQVSSQSFHIGQIDFKLIGAASCTKDGRMHLRIFGDFTHLPSNESEKKCGRFICTVNIVDRSGHMQDWIVGKVVGDFHNDKQFMVGDVSVVEIKQKGFVTQAGNVQLRFDVEIYV